jgi:hypothetical protein
VSGAESLAAWEAEGLGPAELARRPYLVALLFLSQRERRWLLSVGTNRERSAVGGRDDRRTEECPEVRGGGGVFEKVTRVGSHLTKQTHTSPLIVSNFLPAIRSVRKPR